MWNREIFYSKSSSINGWRYDLFGIPISILFQSFYSAFFRMGIFSLQLVSEPCYLCLGVLYVVATIWFSLCVCIGYEWKREELIKPMFLFDLDFYAKPLLILSMCMEFRLWSAEL